VADKDSFNGQPLKLGKVSSLLKSGNRDMAAVYQARCKAC
jgi:hypothetical protein